MHRIGAVALLVLLAAASTAHAAPKPGALDRSFGERGTARADAMEAASAITVEPDGHLLVAGGTSHPGVARFTTRGNLVRSFASKGVYARRSLGLGTPIGVRRDGQRRIHLALTTLSESGPPLTLLRLSTGGRQPAVTPFPGFLAGPLRGVLRPGGGAYVTGAGVLFAVRADGTLDPGFDGDGARVLCTPRYGDECGVRAVAPTPDGGIAFGIWRTKFKDRIVTVNARGVITSSTIVPDSPDAIHVSRSGTIVAGYGYRARPIFRLLPEGGGRYRVRTSALAPLKGSRSGATIRAITTDRRGRIYVLQDIDRLDSDDVNHVTSRVVRLSAGGRQHRGYRASIPVAKGENTNVGTALALDRRGRVVVGGALYVNGSKDNAYGCGIREDTCAVDVRLRVWRLRG